MYNILVVEDEKEISMAVETYLQNQGYNVFKAYNGKEALQLLNQQAIHLALVDVMMPVMDGITFVMAMRKEYDFPVIMLSAKSEDIDKITGLNIGADDYITKPFKVPELLARVNSHLRRYQRYINIKPQQECITCGGIVLNTLSKEVMVDDVSIKLTKREYSILELLMKNQGRVFSADEIYEKVWNDVAVNTDTIMVHIRNIREKIEIDSKNPRYLKVVWGIGYKIEKI
ncbi:MAG: response regulator transcription factor [Oscillospiraceae bacterium]